MPEPQLPTGRMPEPGTFAKAPVPDVSAQTPKPPGMVGRLIKAAGRVVEPFQTQPSAAAEPWVAAPTTSTSPSAGSQETLGVVPSTPSFIPDIRPTSAPFPQSSMSVEPAEPAWPEPTAPAVSLPSAPFTSGESLSAIPTSEPTPIAEPTVDVTSQPPSEPTLETSDPSVSEAQAPEHLQIPEATKEDAEKWNLTVADVEKLGTMAQKTFVETLNKFLSEKSQGQPQTAAPTSDPTANPADPSSSLT